jgi:cbb3-type cytochrome oxidase subunit 3
MNSILGIVIFVLFIAVVTWVLGDPMQGGKK